MTDAPRKNTSYLFSFPFWVFVDIRNTPDLEMIQLGSINIRVYPPFRSAPANFMPMPAIKAQAVPFLNGRRPKHLSDADQSSLLCLATMPQLAIPGVQDLGNTLLWGAEWEQGKVPIAFPMDSLRIDILRSEMEPTEINANELVRKLILNLRSLSRQWWLSTATDPLLGWLRNEFLIDRYGKPEGDFYATGQARSPRGTERPINSSMWSNALSMIEKNVEPAISDQLLLDAQYFANSGDFRRFVLDASAACELAKDAAIERLWNSIKNEPYRRGKILSGYDLGKHIDEQLKKSFGCSFREEEPSSFELIKDLWDARGNVAHGDGACFRKAGLKVEIDDKISAQLSSAAEKCVEWLNQLNI